MDNAREAGLGRRARFVGQVMARLPADSPVPWHRVVCVGGRLAFPADSPAYGDSAPGWRRKAVAFDGARVDLQRHGWQVTLDEILWG
jgi:methylated-DNA-protein-cysteine methyltransferase related protein